MRRHTLPRILTATVAVICLASFGRALPAAQATQAGQRQVPAARERRIALVIGNDRYTGPMALQNARRDATAVAAELRAIGFETTLVEDATRARFGRALETFASTLTSSDVALFYYAGHGVQIGGENYLVPIDYAGNSEAALEIEGVSASRIQTFLGRARVSILVLDACRNNPYSGQRTAGGGLAPMEARGSLVAFATGAGQTAGDNPGGSQGTFTGALLETLRVPGLPIREVFFRVRQRVFDISGGRQFPAIYDGLLGDVVLRPAATTAPPPATPTAPPPRPATPAPGAGPGARPADRSVPSWFIGDFRGINPVTKINIELTVKPDGSISGLSGAGTSRSTPVTYEWVGATQQFRDPTGAYVFEIERVDNGFRARQVGSPSNEVEYRRVYLPPGAPAATDARGVPRDVPRQATPDESATMLAVLNEWKGAWETLDEAAGRRLFPTWPIEVAREDRAKKGIEKVAATITCNSFSVRRDQARLPCRASLIIDYKRQLVSGRGSRVAINQRPPSRTEVTGWTFVMFWNGSTWLIESVSW